MKYQLRTISQKVQDLKTRQEIERVPAGDGEVHVAFSPREQLLAYSLVSGNPPLNRRRSVRLWDLATKQVVAELPLRGSCVGLMFSEDGQTLVADDDSRITLWQVPSGRKLATYPAEQMWWFGSAFSMTRDLSLAAYSSVDSIAVLDLKTGHDRWRAATGHATCLSFSPDGKTLASASTYAAAPIRLWDVATGEELGRLEGHAGWVSSLVFFPDRKTLASASSDQTIRLWDIDSRRPLDTLRGHRLEVWSLALLGDGTTLVSGCKDGTVCVWDTATVRQRRSRLTIPNDLQGFGFAANSKSVITVSPQGQVVEWQGPQFQKQNTLLDVGPSQHGDPCFSADGRWLGTGSENGIVRVWDLNQCALKREITVSKGPAHVVNFVQAADKLYIRDDRNNTFREWDLKTWQETRSWRRHLAPRPIETFSRDGQLQLTLGVVRSGLSA